MTAASESEPICHLSGVSADPVCTAYPTSNGSISITFASSLRAEKDRESSTYTVSRLHVRNGEGGLLSNRLRVKMGLRYAELGLGAQQLSRLYVLSEEKVCIFLPFSLSLSLSLPISSCPGEGNGLCNLVYLAKST